MARTCTLRAFGLQIRCHDVFLWCYVCFVLLRFRLYAFVNKAAALRSIVLRYASTPIAARVFLGFFLRCRFFQLSEYFFVPFPLSLCMESTSYVLSFRMVFFYLETTGWILTSAYYYVRLQPINQSIVQQQQFSGVTFVFKRKIRTRLDLLSASFFVSMLSLKPRPFVQSSFDMEAFR